MLMQLLIPELAFTFLILHLETHHCTQLKYILMSFEHLLFVNHILHGFGVEEHLNSTHVQ